MSSTRGVTVTAKEVGRTVQNGMTMVTYDLYATGFQAGARLSLLEWPTTKPVAVDALDGITLDEHGLAICAGADGTCGEADKPNDPMQLVVLAARGEPVRYGLVAEDKSARALNTIVPFPAQGRDHACAVELRRFLPNAALVWMTATGFPPGAKIAINSSSAGERHQWRKTAAPDGSLATAIEPGVVGTDHGTLLVTATAPGCSPSVSLDWGRGSYHMQ